jgi:hypothetical protein
MIPEQQAYNIINAHVLKQGHLRRLGNEKKTYGAAAGAF